MTYSPLNFIFTDIDGGINQITPYVNNVVKCYGWIGLTYDHYEIIKKLLA